MYPTYGANVPNNATPWENMNYMGVPTYIQNPSPMPVKGKIVTCIQEVEAASIPLDGTVTYYPRTDGKVIYSKYIDMNGRAVVVPYTRGHQDSPVKQNLDERVSKLEVLVSKLEGAVNNGLVTVNPDDAELKQPDGNP